jgi:membrane-associated phospholipid phosphatase
MSASMRPNTDDNARARPSAPGWLLVAALAFGVAAALALPADKSVSDAARAYADASGFPDLAARAVKSLGKLDVQLVVLFAACLTRARQPAVRGLVALAFVGVPVTLLKMLVARERPEHSGSSFPSGDAASVVAAFLPLALRLSALWPPVVFAIAGVAVGRVFAGYHYPSDVLAGIALGVIATWIAVQREPRRWMRLRAKVTAVCLSLALVACVVGVATGSGKAPFVGFAALLLAPLAFVVILDRRRIARRTTDRRRRAPLPR